MGKFDSLFGDDGTSALKTGGALAEKQLRKAKKPIINAANQGESALKEGAETGQEYLSGAYGDQQEAINSAAGAGQDYLTQGTNTAAGIYDEALAPWQQLSDMGTQGINWHKQLLMGDGTPGSQMEVLAQIPGYQFMLDQGIRSLDRQANAAGNPYNATDVMDYATGLASQNFFNMLNAANPYFGMAQNAARERSNVLGQKAGMYDQLGRSQAGLAQWGGGQLSNAAGQYGPNASNVATGLGAGLADVYRHEGDQLSNIQTGIAGNTKDTYTDIASAKAAQPSWADLLMAGGGALTSAWAA